MLDVSSAFDMNKDDIKAKFREKSAAQRCVSEKMKQHDDDTQLKEETEDEANKSKHTHVHITETPEKKSTKKKTKRMMTKKQTHLFLNTEVMPGNTHIESTRLMPWKPYKRMTAMETMKIEIRNKNFMRTRRKQHGIIISRGLPCNFR